jgi:hypothetical protein
MLTIYLISFLFQAYLWSTWAHQGQRGVLGRRGGTERVAPSQVQSSTRGMEGQLHHPPSEKMLAIVRWIMSGHRKKDLRGVKSTPKGTAGRPTQLSRAHWRPLAGQGGPRFLKSKLQNANSRPNSKSLLIRFLGGRRQIDSDRDGNGRKGRSPSLPIPLPCVRFEQWIVYNGFVLDSDEHNGL